MTVVYRVALYFPFVCRVAIALVWLHEGLWMKVLRQDPHEVSIVGAVGSPLGMTATQFLCLIGAGEVLIALAVLAGLYPRFVAGFQIGLLLAMNVTAIFFGRGTIADPIGLLIHNMPLIVCIFLNGFCNPDRTAGAEGLSPQHGNLP